MSKRLGILLLLGFVALFLACNRAAYRGYFQDDELDNIEWAPRLPLGAYGQALLTPRFLEDNFRPAGHFFFYAGEHLFGLDFPLWVALLQAIHILNVWLLWVLMRRLGAPPLAAGAACLFFGLHMALLQAVWKPMYAFDVLCATFCLLAILFYLRRRWLVAFLSFWLAYKAKEIAVMLPLVLLAAELWYGKGDWKRRWLPLAPFFLVSLSFGIQGILLNPNHDNAYTFRFTGAALAATLPFYAGRVFLVPYAGFVVPIAAVVWRQRRVWFGLASMALFLFPLLFLPGRMFPAYCYVPFLGLAVTFSGVAERLHPAVLAVFFLLWAPLDLHELRVERRTILALDDQVREWVTTVADFARTSPKPRAVIYEGGIPGFADWGEKGAVRYLFNDLRLPVYYINEPEAAPLLHAPGVAMLVWNRPARKLTASFHGEQDLSFLRMDQGETARQLIAGWYALEGDFRWTEPRASVRLLRPSGPARLELGVIIVPDQIRSSGPVTVRVTVGGRELEPRSFSRPGRFTTAWDLPPEHAGSVQAEINVDPPYHAPHDLRKLGLAVTGLGFTSSRP